MILTGEQRIGAGQEAVWSALNDPEVLRQCIPGCQSLERDGEDGFSAIVAIKVGPIGARFSGSVRLLDIDAPNGYRLLGQGNGGAAGSARGSAVVRLRDDGGDTVLAFEVETNVSGRIAQLGGAVIDATARQLAGRFFARFGELATAQAPARVAAVADMSRQNEPAASPAQAKAAAAGRSASLGWASLSLLGFALGVLADQVAGGVAVTLALGTLLVASCLVSFEAGRRSAPSGRSGT